MCTNENLRYQETLYFTTLVNYLVFVKQLKITSNDFQCPFNMLCRLAEFIENVNAKLM